MMKSALFRADGSQHIGLGHIMRGIAFAQGLEKTGAKTVFIIRDYEPEIAETIRRYSYGVELIPRNCSFEEDLHLTLELARQYATKAIITDLSNTDVLANIGEYIAYLQGLKSREIFLITLDDVNQIPLPSDIVINPNYKAENLNYDFNGSTKLLLGSGYFLFRQEFIEAVQADREIKKEARNILITMGGSDLFELTGKVASALSKLGKTSDLNLRIVLSIHYAESKKRTLNEVLKDYRGKYELLSGSDRMAELLLWSDLAITAGGTTKYESAITGTPSIIISQVPQQIVWADEFEKEGVALNLGLGTILTEEDIAEAVSRLLSDDALRVKMSKSGKKLVDGKGVERIIAEIPEEVWS